LFPKIDASSANPDFSTQLGRVWTVSVGKWFSGLRVPLVGAAMCSAFDAALPCAAGHDAFRANLVPTKSTHSKCIGQNGFSRSGGFNRLCASAPGRPSQHRQPASGSA
jgi:hypothetical protein